MHGSVSGCDSNASTNGRPPLSEVLQAKCKIVLPKASNSLNDCFVRTMFVGGDPGLGFPFLGGWYCFEEAGEFVVNPTAEDPPPPRECELEAEPASRR